VFMFFPAILRGKQAWEARTWAGGASSGTKPQGTLLVISLSS
jgi:hypothetical protein